MKSLSHCRKVLLVSQPDRKIISGHCDEVNSDLQHSEGTGLVLVRAQQSQGAPQLHQTPENNNKHFKEKKKGYIKMSSHSAGVQLTCC